MKTKHLTIDDLTTTMVVGASSGRIKRYGTDLLFKKSTHKKPRYWKHLGNMIGIYIAKQQKGKINFQMNYVDTDSMMEHLATNVFPRKFKTPLKKKRLQKWFEKCLDNLKI